MTACQCNRMSCACMSDPVTADWTLLATYTNNVPKWTLRWTCPILLPTTSWPSRVPRFGHGVRDNVRVADGSLAPIITTRVLPGANLGVAYTQTLRAVGGVEPMCGLVSGTLPPGLSWPQMAFWMRADGSGTEDADDPCGRCHGVASTNTFSLAVANFRRLPWSKTLRAARDCRPDGRNRPGTLPAAR